MGKRRQAHFEVFKSMIGGGWYWRLVAGNSKCIADGSEGYASKGNAKRAARRFNNRHMASMRLLEIREV